MDHRFESLFRKHYSGVVRYISHQGFSTEEAQELAQETFLRAFRSYDGFRGDSEFPAWLFTIARNLVRNKIRDQRTLKRSATVVELPEVEPQEDENSVNSDSGERALATTAEDPLDRLLSEERSQGLRKALSELPPQMRRAALLRYGQGLKYREIADILRISINTVRSQLHQARLRLTPVLDRSGEPTDHG